MIAQIGKFNYLITNDEAMVGTHLDSKSINGSYDCNAYIDKTNTYFNVIIPATITYNNKFYLVKKIGSHAFRHSHMSAIKIGRFVEEIGFVALDYCRQLKTVEFDKYSSLTTIGASFGVDSLIESIVFPPNLNYISDDLFVTNKVLKYIWFGGDFISICTSKLSSFPNINIFVLPNFKNTSFCDHYVTIVGEFPADFIPTCKIYNNYNAFRLSYTHIAVFILI